MSYIATCRAGLAALQAKKEVNILAIESSCDETAAAVIQNGRKILSSAVFTQIPLHAVYGGVVPEIASRAHVDAVDRMVDYALNEADMKLRDVDAIGVTYGPGLVGALLRLTRRVHVRHIKGQIHRKGICFVQQCIEQQIVLSILRRIGRHAASFLLAAYRGMLKPVSYTHLTLPTT